MKLYLISEYPYIPTMQSTRKRFQIDKMFSNPEKKINLYKNYNQARQKAGDYPIITVECTDRAVKSKQECVTVSCSKVIPISVSLIKSKSYSDLLCYISNEEEEHCNQNSADSNDLQRLAAPDLLVDFINAPLTPNEENLIRKGFSVINTAVSAAVGAGFWFLASGQVARALPSLGYDPVLEALGKELSLVALATGGSFLLLKLQSVKNIQKPFIAKAFGKGLALFHKMVRPAPIATRNEFNSPEDEINYNVQVYMNKTARDSDKIGYIAEQKLKNSFDKALCNEQKSTKELSNIQKPANEQPSEVNLDIVPSAIVHALKNATSVKSRSQNKVVPATRVLRPRKKNT